MLGGGIDLTEKLNLGGRIVGLLADEKDDVVSQERAYFDAWVSYTF
jgi:hypothetical protein